MAPEPLQTPTLLSLFYLFWKLMHRYLTFYFESMEMVSQNPSPSESVPDTLHLQKRYRQTPAALWLSFHDALLLLNQSFSVPAKENDCRYCTVYLPVPLLLLKVLLIALLQSFPQYPFWYILHAPYLLKKQHES